MSDFVKRLAAFGDPLERVIACYYDQLGGVLEPYAGVWASYIEPRRDKKNPSRVDDEWMAFAGDHYTALLRVFHAYQSYSRMMAALEKIEGGDVRAELLLEVHGDTASLWEHIGGVIDNLGMCYCDAPNIKARAQHRTLIAPKDSWLEWAYARRTQFVHSRIVPQGLWGNDTVIFNFYAFNEDEQIWVPSEEHETVVAEYYRKEVWSRFLHEISGEWYKFWAAMKDRHPAVDTKAIEIPNIKLADLRPGALRLDDSYLPPSTIKGDGKSPLGDSFIAPSGN